MKFIQLIEYNTRNTFLEKKYTKYGVEASSRHFYKKSKFSLSLDEQPEMLYILFQLCVQVKVHQNIVKLRCWPLALTLYNGFRKTKKSSRTSVINIFGMIFEEKYFSCYIL